MILTEDDIRFIASHITHNISSLSERYMENSSTFSFDDFVIINVATDLNYKFSKYQIQEAFEDYRIKLLLEFYITESDFKEFETIH